jgi:hypothetical protein
MNIHLIGKIGLIALVVAVAFLTAWQGSGPVWGTVSAVAIGGGVAVAVFYDPARRYLRGRPAHGPNSS